MEPILRTIKQPAIIKIYALSYTDEIRGRLRGDTNLLLIFFIRRDSRSFSCPKRMDGHRLKNPFVAVPGFMVKCSYVCMNREKENVQGVQHE